MKILFGSKDFFGKFGGEVIISCALSYLSPVSPEGERQLVCLRKRLIDKSLQDLLTRCYETLATLSEDSQEADKLVLPALGGDRGGR